MIEHRFCFKAQHFKNSLKPFSKIKVISQQTHEQIENQTCSNSIQIFVIISSINLACNSLRWAMYQQITDNHNEILIEQFARSSVLHVSFVWTREINISSQTYLVYCVTKLQPTCWFVSWRMFDWRRNVAVWSIRLFISKTVE